MSNLGDYLTRGGQMRRSEGVWDCCTFPANWALECGHRDPMAKWRGAYSNEVEAEDFIAEAARRGEGLGHGGLEHLFIEGMWDAGIPQIDQAADFLPGDIGIVTLAGNEAGAVYTGKRWAFVPDRGMAFVSLDRDCIARAWRPFLYHG